MKKAKGKTTIENLKFCLVVLTFAFLLLSFSTLSSNHGWACPLCKEALFDPGQIQQKLSTAKGYALSIGLLLAMPLGLIGSVAFLIRRAQCRAHKLP